MQLLTSSSLKNKDTCGFDESKLLDFIKLSFSIKKKIFS